MSLYRSSAILCDHSLMSTKTGMSASSATGTTTVNLLAKALGSIESVLILIGLIPLGNSPLPSPTITVRGVSLGPYGVASLGSILKVAEKEN